MDVPLTANLQNMTIIELREDEESTSFYKKNERLFSLLMIVGTVDGVGISDT